jgi:hypothetical protein
MGIRSSNGDNTTRLKSTNYFCRRSRRTYWWNSIW